MLEAVSLPWCTVLLPEPIDSGRGRLFAAYRARRGYRWLLGQGVLDEFGTLSSPVWLAPSELIGRMYDFGIAFGFRRDPELPVDGGWPPVCIGLDLPAPPLPAGWESELTAAIEGAGATAGPGGRVERSTVGARRLDRFTLAGVTILETDAPLLPHQLGRLCDASSADLTLAIATGQRIVRSRDGAPARVRAVSESALEALTAAAAGAAP